MPDANLQMLFLQNPGYTVGSGLKLGQDTTPNAQVWDSGRSRHIFGQNHDHFTITWKRPMIFEFNSAKFKNGLKLNQAFEWKYPVPFKCQGTEKVNKTNRPKHLLKWRMSMKNFHTITEKIIKLMLYYCHKPSFSNTKVWQGQIIDNNQSKRISATRC